MGEGMNNKELIHELRMCVSEELCDLAADALETAERQLDGAALLNGLQAQEIAELTTAIEEADRARMSVLHDLTSAQTKLIIARDELLRCKQIMLHECGIGLVNEVVLAQIGGEE